MIPGFTSFGKSASNGVKFDTLVRFGTSKTNRCCLWVNVSTLALLSLLYPVNLAPIYTTYVSECLNYVVVCQHCHRPPCFSLKICGVRIAL